MSPADLLQAISETANRGEPLPPMLRARDEPELAAALEAGQALPAALAGRLPDTYRDLLAGPRPGLAEAALFVADDLRRRRRDQDVAVAAVAHPLLTWCGLVLACGVFLFVQGRRPDAWWIASATLATLFALIPLLGLRHTRHGPAANRYARAALAVRWRLPEERLTAVLGGDLHGLAPVLTRPGAEEHLRRLAEFHRLREGQVRRRLLVLTGFCLYAAAGALLLGTLSGPLSEFYALLMETYAA